MAILRPLMHSSLTKQPRPRLPGEHNMSEIKNHSKAYWTCQILGWGIYGLLNTVFLSAFQTVTAQKLGITVFGSVQLLLWTHLLRIIFKKRHWVTLPLWKLFIRVLIADLVIAIISQSIQFLGKWRTVFNIGGNKYRLIVDMRYDLGRTYIR